MAVPDNAQPKILEASGVVKATRGYLKRIIVSHGGTVAKLTIYDNASAASGTKLFEGNFMSVVAAKTTSKPIDIGVAFENGCYANFDSGADEIDFLNAYIL